MKAQGRPSTHERIKVRLPAKTQDWSVNLCMLPVKFHFTSGNLCKSARARLRVSRAGRVYDKDKFGSVGTVSGVQVSLSRRSKRKFQIRPHKGGPTRQLKEALDTVQSGSFHGLPLLQSQLGPLRCESPIRPCSVLSAELLTLSRVILSYEEMPTQPIWSRPGCPLPLPILPLGVARQRRIPRGRSMRGAPSGSSRRGICRARKRNCGALWNNHLNRDFTGTASAWFWECNSGWKRQSPVSKGLSSWIPATWLSGATWRPANGSWDGLKTPGRTLTSSWKPNRATRKPSCCAVWWPWI